MGQITATRNLVATKVVRLAGQNLVATKVVRLAGQQAVICINDGLASLCLDVLTFHMQIFF